MKLQRIKLSPSRAPACEAEVTEQGQRWREQAGRTDMHCERKARFIFEGKGLCDLHAGAAALAYLLEHGVGLESAYKRGHVDAQNGRNIFTD
jgi:hypothetical protein